MCHRSTSKGLGKMQQLLRCLEVIDGLDPTYDIGGRLDVFYDLVHALVGHGGLVKGIGDDAGGVDA